MLGNRSLYCDDALDFVREIAQHIRFTPKRSHLSSDKLAQFDCSGVSTITRWMTITIVIDAVLRDYSILVDALDEIYLSTHDEYGFKLMVC